MKRTQGALKLPKFFAFSSKRLFWLLLVWIIVVGISILFIVQATGNEVYVNAADTTSDIGGCGTSVNPCQTVQAGIDTANEGDTVLVATGNYVEQISINKDLHIKGNGASSTFITAPDPMGAAVIGHQNIVSIFGSGVDVELEQITVRGPSTPTVRFSGIFVYDSAHASIHNCEILAVRDNPFGGGQRGIAIQVGRQANATTGTADIYNNVIADFQKLGILVDNTGSHANILSNTITGHGPTSVNGQNAIQISRGATATISNNDISEVSWTGGGNAAVGVLLFDAGATVITNNLVHDTDVGVDSEGGDAALHTITGNGFSDSVVAAINNNSPGTLQASGNFFGNSNGPTHPGNSGGSGDVVSDFVNYSGFLSAAPDLTRPIVTALNPAANQTNVSTLHTVMVDFSKNMDASTITSSSFFIKNQALSLVPGVVSYSSLRATFTPNDPFTAGETYTATLLNTVKDTTGNLLELSSVWSFTIGQGSGGVIKDVFRPAVIGTYPANHAEGIRFSEPIVVRFDEDMDPRTIHEGYILVTQNGKPVAGDWSYSNAEATFIPHEPWLEDATIRVEITPEVLDEAGNGLSYTSGIPATPYIFSFTIRALPHTPLPKPIEDLPTVTIPDRSEASLPEPIPGELVKLPGFNTVYYLDFHGELHPFVSESAFHTWVATFVQVRDMSDAEFEQYALGSAVPYRPGVRLVKLAHDSMVYVVDSYYHVRPILNETLAEELYGEHWRLLVDDVDAEYFSKYQMGEMILSTDDFSPAQATRKAGVLWQAFH